MKVAKVILRLNPQQVFKVDTVPQFSWKEYKDELSLVSILIALSSATLAYSTWFLGVRHLPGAQVSIMTLVLSSVNYVIQVVMSSSQDFTDWLIRAFIILLIVFPKKIPSVIGNLPEVTTGLPKFAMLEECAFRRNAESWTVIERIKACVSFGILHFLMIVVPLGFLPILTICGGIFMGCYLMRFRATCSQNAAIKFAATVHTTYNIFVLSGVLLVLNIHLVINLLTRI
jgi:hypothetical protein